jgi:hypothetical protein
MEHYTYRISGLHYKDIIFAGISHYVISLNLNSGLSLFLYYWYTKIKSWLLYHLYINHFYSHEKRKWPLIIRYLCPCNNLNSLVVVILFRSPINYYKFQFSVTFTVACDVFVMKRFPPTAIFSPNSTEAELGLTLSSLKYLIRVFNPQHHSLKTF